MRFGGCIGSCLTTGSRAALKSLAQDLLYDLLYDLPYIATVEADCDSTDIASKQADVIFVLRFAICHRLQVDTREACT